MIQPIFDSAEPFYEGLAQIGAKEEQGFNKFGFIDVTGRIVVEPQFDYAEHFSEGMAAVRVNGKIGFIDKTGKIAIQPQFDSWHSFKDGFALVGLCDLNDPRYGHLSSQYRAFLTMNCRWGYIDKSGKYLYEPSI